MGAEEETTAAAATEEPAMGAMGGSDGTQPLDGLPETASMPISVDDAMADQTPAEAEEETTAAVEEETTAAAEEETTAAAATEEPAMGAMEAADGTQPLDGLPEVASMPISVDDAMADQTPAAAEEETTAAAEEETTAAAATEEPAMGAMEGSD